jgi:nucleoporin GLE1
MPGDYNFLVVFLLFLHSDSEAELDGQVEPYRLMEKRNLEKSILLELEREHHLKVQVCAGHYISFYLQCFSN